MIYLTPAHILQNKNHAKREGRIAPSLSGRSASPIKAGTVRARTALVYSGQNMGGVMIISNSLRS